ncbi:uncharacterized protein LOC122256167 isoform X1 [Penaeus japonicus]|uniref:uncharacterized protein LOC122256167 isoform X1 n=1 Tax=Penaeus japonicus TaxID=27405 RepID=UPI001C7167EA|nr:uncharacterized protein LOC122256167 isoform X1 [Penaeus japonicus]
MRSSLLVLVLVLVAAVLVASEKEDEKKKNTATTTNKEENGKVKYDGRYEHRVDEFFRVNAGVGHTIGGGKSDTSAPSAPSGSVGLRRGTKLQEKLVWPTVANEAYSFLFILLTEIR